MKKNFRFLITFLMLLGLSFSQSVWGESVRIYCKTPSWWNTDGAGCSIHYWGGTSSTGWPGARMSQVSGTSDVWYIDVDKANLTNLKFARVTGSGTLSYLSAQTGNLTLDSDAGKRLYTISNSSGCWDSDKCTCSGSWGKYAPTGAVCGGWNSWNPTTNPFIDGVANITLTTGTTHQFKILLGTTYYSNSGTMTKDNYTGWTMSSSESANCKITPSLAGVYQFVYSDSKLTVYYPYSINGSGLTDLNWTAGSTLMTCDRGTYSKTFNNENAGKKSYRITRATDYGGGWDKGIIINNEKSNITLTLESTQGNNKEFTTAKVANITVYTTSSETWVIANPVNLITYHANGATSGTVPVDDAASIKVKDNSGNLVKNGYTFSGWNTAANGLGTDYAVNSDFNPSAATTLYAKWTPTNYTITYKDQDNADFSGTWGSGSHPANYNIETATITLDQPTKTNYVFGGWYTASDCSGSAVTQITKGSTGNKTFYAKWLKNAPNGAIIGTMNSWDHTANPLSSGSVTINLTASITPYEFKVLYGSTDYYGNTGTMYRNNCSGWTMSTSDGNCKILADKTGDYVFTWNNSTHQLSVTYAESASRTIYLDLSSFTDWEKDTETFHVGDYNGADKPMTKVTDCANSHLYSAEVGTIDIPYVFKRMKPDLSKVWAQADVVVVSPNNACRVTGWNAGTAITATLSYDVTYDMKGHGTQIAAGCVQSGGTVTKPTDPTASGYEFDGWYKETGCTNAWNFESDVVTKPITLYAKWVAMHTVSVAVNDAHMGQVNVASVTNVGAVTKSEAITATPKAGCYFTGWTIPDGVTIAEGDASSTTIKIYATADSKTITANFAGRYAFRGSLNISGGPKGGMPGWDNTTPVSFNDVWSGQGHVTYTLQANKTYKFKLRDMTQNKYAGFATSDQYLAINGTYFTQLNGESGQDVLFTTRGAGDYEFLFAFDSYTSTAYCTPKVKSVVAFTSYQIPFGVNDANMGTITATANDSSFTNNQWVAQGDNVVFTATPLTGYVVEGWYTDAACTQGKHDAGATTYTINSIAAAETAYVKFQPLSYTITYKDKDGADYSGSNLSSLPATHTYGTATNLVNGAKAGYSFDGWFEDSACEGTVVTSIGATAKTANFTLYAKWTQSEFYYAISKGVNDVNMGTVTSNATDESHVLAGTTITFTAHSNDGYEVEAWYTNAECTEGRSDEGQINHNVTIDADKTVYVKFKPQTYTIIYKDQNGADFSGEHKLGYPTIHTYGTATELRTATKSGYVFAGWHTSSDCSTGLVTSLGATDYTSNMTLYAKWTPAQYTITYKDKDDADYSGSNLSSLPNKHTYGTATDLVDGERTGYVFSGWFENAACTGSVVTSIAADAKTADFTLYAKWTPNASGGAIIGTMNSWNPLSNPMTDGVVTITLAADTTYEFKVLMGTDQYGYAGTLTNADYSEKTMSTSAVACKITTYGAGDYIFVFDNATHKLTVHYPYFVSSHGASGSLPGLTGTPGTYPFTYSNGIYSRVCSNASAGEKQYRITRRTSNWDWDAFEKNIAIDNTQSNVTVSLESSKKQNKLFTTAKQSNITIYFNLSTMKTWVIADPYYKITYDVNGGSGTAPTDTTSCKVAYNTVQSCTASMQKAGYVFTGWNTQADGNGTHYNAGDKPTLAENLTLYAEWKEESQVAKIKVYYYNMYDWNGVKCHAYAGNLPATTWPGFAATLESRTHNNHSIYSVTFYAGQYNTIKFSDANNGSNQTGACYNVSDNNGRCIKYDKSEVPNTWWDALPTQNYLFTYNNNGHGLQPDGQWVDSAATAQDPGSLSATGYTFGGWYKDQACTAGQEWSFATPIIATTTIYAKWTPTQYYITYNTNGGVEVPQGTYTKETATFSLPITTKTGSVFDGWFDNSGLTGDPVTQIVQGSTGNKTFWAKWVSANVYLEGRARVKTGENTYTKVSDSGSEWATDSKNIEFTYNSSDAVYYLNLNQTVGEVEAYMVSDQHHYFRVGIADGDDGAVTCLGVTGVENDYEFTTEYKSATLLANANKSAWFNPANVNAPNVLAGPVMLKYDPTNLKLAYCAPLLTFAYAGDLNMMSGYAIELEDASVTPMGLSDSTIVYQYKLGDGAWTTWSSDIVAAEGTYKLRATASGNNEFGQAVTGVVSNEITVTVTKPAIEAQVTHVNDVATANPIVRVNDNFTITPTVTGVPDDQTVQVCYKWITVPAGSAIDKSKNIFERVGETSAAKVTIDVAGDYKIRVYVTSSDICPDLGIRWDSTDVDVHVKGDEITVYAKIDKGITDWEDKYIYYWKGDAKAKAWPGFEMNYIGKDSVDYEWYSYNIVGYKTYQGGNLLFNDGTETYGKQQTTNLAMPNDDAFYMIKTVLSEGKRTASIEPTIDVTKRVILMTDTTALYQYVTIALEGKGVFFANREKMNYTYTLTSKPDGSTAVLNQKHQLLPDVAGNYEVTIRCEAGSLDAENSFVLRVQPNPVTLTASAGASANIGATTTLTVASSQSIGGLYKTFTVIEPGMNDPITFQSGTTSTTSNSYTLRSSGTYTFGVVLTDNEGVIAGKAQCSLTVNPKTYYIKHPFDGSNWSWKQLTYSEADGVYRYPASGSSEVAKYVAGNGADINTVAKDDEGAKKYHETILNPDNLTGTTEVLFTYDVTTDEVTVYALNKRLYRIKSICGDNTYYSNAMTNDGDAISFFAQKGGQLVWQERATAAAEWEDQSVVVTTTAEESGIYTATPTIKAASFSLTAYTGDLTVFSQLTNAVTNDGTPSAPNGKLTKFVNQTQGEYYNYYWVKFCATNNGTNVRQAMATIGNSINHCIAATLPYYELPAEANVRYAYSDQTNSFTRTYLAGSGDTFLRIYGENIKDKNNSAALTKANMQKFEDGSNWVFTSTVYGTVDATHSATAMLMTEYNSTNRWILAESGLEADPAAERTILDQNGTTAGEYKLHVIYDYKTNRITSGWDPIDQTINSDISIPQLIATRTNDGAASEFTIAAGQVLVTNQMVEHIVITQDMFNSWGGGTTAGGYKTMFFWFSVPYEFKAGDIYGFNGTYRLATEQSSWEIQSYRGELRDAGTAGKSAWKRPSEDMVMDANAGYVLAVRAKAADFKTADGVSQIRFFIPSAGSVTLKPTATVELMEYAENKAWYNRDWHVMAVPVMKSGRAFVNDAAEKFEYVYRWTWADGSRWYEPIKIHDTSAEKHFNFMSGHAYMVQGHGNLTWNYNVQSGTLIDAPRRDVAKTNKDLRVDLVYNDEQQDKTYVLYRENGSRDYEIGRDLEKIVNDGRSMIYSEHDIKLASICLADTDMMQIPLTVVAAKDGEYTMRMPAPVAGIEPVLYDAHTGTETYLNYVDTKLELQAGTYTGRFFLYVREQPFTPTQVENAYGEGSKVYKFIDERGLLFIIRDGHTYDAFGHLVK